MKNKTFLLLTLAVAAMSLSSCTKIIDFNGEITKPYLVMVSQPQADSVWHVRLTKSRFFLNSNDIPNIENARIYMTVNGVDVNGIASYDHNGIYNTGVRPQPGDSLFMRVVVPNEGEMTSGCRIPLRPLVNNPEVTFDTTVYYWGTSTDTNDNVHLLGTVNGDVHIKLLLHDPSGEHNYYMVRLRSDNHNFSFITIDDDIIFKPDATDEVFDLDLEESENSGMKVLFSDENINGQVHPISINVPAYSLYYDEDLTADYACQVEVYALSRDLYLYLKTTRSASNTDGLSQIIAEPVQVHTNINGGIGILGGMSKSVINIQL